MASICKLSDHAKHSTNICKYSFKMDFVLSRHMPTFSVIARFFNWGRERNTFSERKIESEKQWNSV